MTAVTETSSGLTEFSGHRKVFFAKINGVVGSLTLTVEEMVSIDAVLTTLAEQSTENCNTVCVSSVSSNVITLRLIAGAGTSATTDALDYYVMVIGKCQTDA